ncbi:MAG: hypothetical protein JXA73_03170 [Acidobacteria bacterium]|nr:hypothetical protein [Acidobacteriota bacterium]
MATMSNKSLESAIDSALAGLKDFQRATVDTVYQRLFDSDQKSMLVADEVGLGKTVVARGVIAMALRNRLRMGVNSPFKVTYVCSNQVIAEENVGKLNVFPEIDLAKGMVRRIAYLAYSSEDDNNPYEQSLVLNVLTPGTSFRISRGTGTWSERSIIYSLLCANPELDAHRNGLACLLRGSVQREIEDVRRWMEQDRNRIPLRNGLADDLLAFMHKRILKPMDAPLTFMLLGSSENTRISLYDTTHQMAEILRANNEDTHRHACNEVSKMLRRTLIDACLKYVDADLFILDEFQRFRDLIDPDSLEEEAEIARKIFKNRRARILLLSATPFKAFTGEIDLSNGEDHYRDFKTVLRFLTEDDEKTLGKYEQHRQALYRQLFSLEKGALDLNPLHREQVEQILRSIICRTERQIVATDPGAMISDKWRMDRLAFDMHDVRNYISTDQIAQSMSLVYQGKRHVISQPMGYCKSSPHPFSYLDGYALKKLLKECRRNNVVRTTLKKNIDAWLNLQKISRYKLVVGTCEDQSSPAQCAHAPLSQLVQEAIGTAGSRLLWVPPSLPYYELGGAFKEAVGFSKTLVFSGWVMVPRMIATLLSYEVERQTIGDSNTREERESEVRRYFPPSNKPNYKRHPVPLLVFRAEEKDAMTAKGMSNFCCLYPSVALASAYEPTGKLNQSISMGEIRNILIDRINKMIEDAKLFQYENRDGSPDKWYWAAPALLDHSDMRLRRRISYWLCDPNFVEQSSAFQWASADREESGKRIHVKMFHEAFQNPDKLKLGRMPRDLPEVLADITLGSPAVVSLRTLLRLFPDGGKSVTKEHLRGAFEIADEFINLFNKPESICAVRLTTKQHDYWRQVLRYCADGCLQAVMDEYVHLTKGQKTTMVSTVKHIVNTINITVSSINVDSLATFLKGKPQRMRCHYAVDFGNQKLETEEGQKRATSIRENFNSPFRPFVLATTSIGQEGLDFHQYCRKIVHWNLPSNPIDLEQREGRINRFKGLVIRQQLARKYGARLRSDSEDQDIWQNLFAIASQEEQKRLGKCELVPYWHVDTDGVKIERIIPMYPFSRDQGKLGTILKTLALYRLAFGQPRQVELIEHLLAKDFTSEEIESIRQDLLIDLSPISYKQRVDQKMG